MNAVRQSLASEDVRKPRRAWRALAVLVVVGGVACDSGDGSGLTEPALPGAILLTTETTGFLKADGYELLVNGESKGTIGANDEMTLSGLEPATYEVALGGVADNCVVESVAVPVASEQTAEASLSVVCGFAEPTSYTLQFNRRRPNLDTGEIAECPFGICPSGAEWDLYVHYNSQSDPNSVIRQNQSIGVEIAHLPGVVLADLTEADVEGATFTTDLVATPFDAGRVILIRTDLGNVYALGNPVQDGQSTLTFDAALVAGP
jgi:hypothetical protein